MKKKGGIELGCNKSKILITKIHLEEIALILGMMKVLMTSGPSS